MGRKKHHLFPKHSMAFFLLLFGFFVFEESTWEKKHYLFPKHSKVSLVSLYLKALTFSTPNILWSIEDTLCMQTLDIQNFLRSFCTSHGGEEGKGPLLMLGPMP
jgi:hypothetical protein